MKRGIVKYWKGAFGFIAGDDARDCFVHYTAIQVEGYRSLTVGDRVEYETETTERGLRATKVFRVADDDATTDERQP